MLHIHTILCPFDLLPYVYSKATVGFGGSVLKKHLKVKLIFAALSLDLSIIINMDVS